MASHQFVSNASYWQYKDDTSYVLKWIDQTAKACGWKRQKTQQTVPTPSQLGSQSKTSNEHTNEPTSKPTGAVAPISGRLKGKDRKAAKKQAAQDAAAKIEKEKRDSDEKGTSLSAQEILEQANLISTRLPMSQARALRPPPSVMHALGRAIRLRQRFSTWFETTRPDDHKSNSAHRHFVKVLERIADLFLQGEGTTTVDLDGVESADTTSDASKASTQNRFESLLKHVVQDETEPEPIRSTKSRGPAIKDNGTTSGQKYHMEVKDSQESALMVFTLFTDLQSIKKDVKHLWKRCFKDGADMIIATVMTAQALAFVQRSEERIMSVLDDARCQEGVAEEGFREDAWSFPGTYCRLLSILRDPTDVQAIVRFENSSRSSGNDGGTVSINDLTFAFSARRLGYFTRSSQRLFCTPLLQEFKHNPLAFLNAEIDKITERDKALCLALVQLAKQPYILPLQEHSTENSEGNRRIEARKDPILSSLHPVWTQKEVNLESVFAAEIMLDIKEICNAFPASRPSYHKMYDSYMDLLGLKVERKAGYEPVLLQSQESPLIRGAGIDGWESKVREIMTKVSCILPEHINAVKVGTKMFETVPARNSEGNDSNIDIDWEQKFDITCAESLEIYRGVDPLALKYNIEEYKRSRLLKFIVLRTGVSYLFDNYPMFTTVRDAFMQTLIESAGIEILNADKYGIGTMAHIYNASRQLGLGKLRWPAMDRLIDIHKVALFAGDVPTTPAAMLRSFSHRLWGPKGKLTLREKKRRLNRPITMMKPSAMTQAYNKDWETAGRIPFWYTLEANALTAAAEKNAGRRNQLPTNLSFVDSIPVMEEYLTKQLHDVRVDYMEIDRVSIDFNEDLLKHARGEFTKQANRVVQPEAIDPWSGVDFASESFHQEAQLHEVMAKYGGDPSRLPVQDCDYLQDSINCLANVLRAKGIGDGPNATDGDEGVNMPTSLTRFRIQG